MSGDDRATFFPRESAVDRNEYGRVLSGMQHRLELGRVDWHERDVSNGNDAGRRRTPLPLPGEFRGSLGG